MSDDLLQIKRGDHALVLAEQEYIASPLLPASRHDGRSVLNFRFSQRGADGRTERAQATFVRNHLGIGNDVNPAMTQHPIDEIAQQPLGIVPSSQVVDVL